LRFARAAARSAPASSLESRSRWRRERAMRDQIVLACDVCKRKNYRASRNKKRTAEKLALKKYCPACRSHTVHKEGKV